MALRAETLGEDLAQLGSVVGDHVDGLVQVGAPAEDPLVGHLMLLYDGAMTAAKLTHDSAAIRMAGTLAQQQTVGAPRTPRNKQDT